MTSISRRKFLTNCLTAGIVLISNDAISYHPKNSGTALTGNLTDAHINECITVYHEWLQKEEDSPTNYLSKTMEHYQLEAHEITKAAELDFLHDELFVINGIQLSKTEAAFLAEIGFKFSV